MRLHFIALLALSLIHSEVSAADPAPASAAELAANLSTMRQDPGTYVRLRLEIKHPSGGASSVLQVQIKERRTKTGTDLVYQVLFPKEQKGESVLLRKTGNRAATGSVFTPPDGLKTLDASKMRDSLLGSDLSYEDVIEDFFTWDQQTIVGNEAVNRVPCVILESKPGKGEHSSYASVRTWVDAKRTVPLRIEKYNGSGQLLRRIETTDVVKDNGHYIPAKLVVQSPHSDTVTELDGSKIKHNAVYTDDDFTPEGLKKLTVPSSD